MYDKIIDSASKEELLAMARKAQAERDDLVTENGKLDSRLTQAEIAIHTAQQENRAPVWPPASQAQAAVSVLKAQGFWPETCEVCQGPEPLLEQRCRTCIERRYKQVLREHGEALHKSGGRLGAVLSLRATPAYQGRVLAMVRIRKFLGIPEVEIGGRHA